MAVAVAAVAVMLGHMYPVFLRFNGGKGVATALGVLLAINLYIAAGAIATWIIIAFFFRISSLAALRRGLRPILLVLSLRHGPSRARARDHIEQDIKRQAMKVDFLRELLRNDSIYIASNITVHNLQPVSTFLGKIGRPDLGELPVAEFKRRQRLHRDAEIGAMRDVAEFIGKAQEIYRLRHFINDAGGSLVELGDERTEKTLAEHTLILYLKADEEMERELVRRAVSDPKPLYYNEKFLDEKLADYVAEAELDGPDQVVPDEFVRWIFPRSSPTADRSTRRWPTVTATR